MNDAKVVKVACTNHHRLLVDGLWKFLTCQRGTDFDLQWGGWSVRIHRLIVEIFMPTLAVTGSPVVPASSDLLTGENLELLLEFLYRGSVTVQERELDRLHEIAKLLHFKVLSDAVESVMTVEAADSLNRCVRSHPTVSQDDRPIIRSPNGRTSQSEAPSVEIRPVSSIRKRQDRSEPEPELFQKPDVATFSATPLSVTDPTLSCGQRDFKSRSKKRFKIHLAEHDNSALTFKCETCSKQFVSEKKYQSHMSTHSVTADVGGFRCSYCEFETAKQWKYVYHLKAVHEVNANGDACPKKYHCEECSLSFVCLSVFKVHRRIKHTKDRPYKCHLCPYASSRKGDLGVHVNVAHLKLRRAMCETCGFRAISVAALDRHRRSHTGEKPIQCHQCGRSYFDSSSFKRHERRHAIGDGTHTCHICDRAFNKRFNLNAHLRKEHNISKSTLSSTHLQQQEEVHADVPPDL